jgi:hypothetical protein
MRILGLPGIMTGAFLALVACATAANVPFRAPGELAGTWQGVTTGRSGRAIASLTIKEDGSFTGTMYLDGGDDQDFTGVITVIRPGQALYRSSESFGRVVLVEQAGSRSLRFQPDGGGVASVFAPSP